MSARTLVVISSGLGQPSSTRLLADRLAEATADAVVASGAEVDVHVIELRAIAHDIVNAMLTGFPTGVLREELDRLAAADGVIAVTPLYQASYAGLFKSFVDILDEDALRGTPVLVGATGGTPRHSLALDYALRPLFSYLHADLVGTGVFAATDDWATGGDAVTPLPARIRRAGQELAATMLAREPKAVRDPFVDAPSFDELLGG